MEKRLKDRFSISELLQRFPNGFAVSKSGLIYEVVSSFPMPDRPGWGQIIARNPELRPGDEKMFEDSLSVEEFYQRYGRPIETIEEAERLKSTLKVGLEQKKNVLIREAVGGFELYLE